MKKRKTIILFILFLLILSFFILNDDDLKELYELHYANKLLIINEEGETDYIIEDENLSEDLHHVFYSETKFPDNIDKWEKVTNISFYNNDEKIMDGKIIRLNVELSDKELFDQELGHFKAINDYYYLYTVEVKDFIFKKTYCSTVEESLITRLLELDQ